MLSSAANTGAPMPAAISPTLAATFPPPVMEARRWLQGLSFPPDRPLVNLSQAAPVDPPPEALRREMARVVQDDADSHLYGPVLGNPALRAEIAARWSGAYAGVIRAEDVAITSGCNQAFCAALATVAAPGDAVILPSPWYFNHRMWLETMGISCVPLPSGPGMVPDPAVAEALIGSSVRAIVLVTPNNPTGAEYPPEVIEAFFRLARARDLLLILDETYRDFHSSDAPPHGLFANPSWRDNLVHLYSFSKVFRLTGHRTGALIGDPARLAEAEKFLDSIAICPPQLGQKAALHGLRHLSAWVAGERAEILRRRARVIAGFRGLNSWRLLGCGAYFAYAEHPFDLPSDELARRLVQEQSLLTLPGTMFTPPGDMGGQRQLRIAFANAGDSGLDALFTRLADFRP
jgi:aspartate/methionine/tyrosine aminotransferase